MTLLQSLKFTLLPNVDSNSVDVTLMAEHGSKLRVGLNNVTKALEQRQVALVIVALPDVAHKHIFTHMPPLLSAQGVPVVVANTSSTSLGRLFGVRSALTVAFTNDAVADAHMANTLNALTDPTHALTFMFDLPWVVSGAHRERETVVGSPLKSVCTSSPCDWDQLCKTTLNGTVKQALALLTKPQSLNVTKGEGEDSLTSVSGLAHYSNTRNQLYTHRKHNQTTNKPTYLPLNVSCGPNGHPKTGKPGINQVKRKAEAELAKQSKSKKNKK